ncbi:tRNA (adenosine(37)-N6)-threonylcarbamoyltransferase complex dimerization subunit type 1 TsaB [Micrococcus porci]|uniref:tRNA (adenosine(37)-N6)-threonylcarbamoyltransferase complex dimerization subunit type 1 TsaB n=1 Tax=Micrococcus porci TaxID=2856555 RepID=UPI001CCB869F|nr:tRNA (adenosine(37)-N6)-threonylcarbamoyltransferase complex dimerization subunit type 1 TsaB [Micrococcus porci]UBH25668.1 tRNA (adenosine(37)-N6)-threonylcarbamoyltransferase complex dimerization subunit type 1 TsaB [Micrococcus porci]
MPLLLALDSSSAASVALLRDGEPLAAWSTADTTSHAEVLAPAVRQVLAEAGVAGGDLDGIAAGVGPGPFTGLRAGLATAEALGFAWDVPVHGIRSLDALAHRAGTDAFAHAVEEFVVVTDARRREVYWAHYAQVGGQPTLLHGPFVTPAAEVTPLPAYGAGAGLYPEALHAVDGWEGAVPDAVSLGRVDELALRRGRGVLPPTPLYLRESDATVPAPRTPARPAGA